MWTGLFWRRAAERAVKTFGQVFLVAVGQDVLGFDVFQFSWPPAIGLSLGGAALSVAMSLASVKVGDDPQSPSLVSTGRHHAEPKPPHVI
jgi:hypothetical protein